MNETRIPAVLSFLVAVTAVTLVQAWQFEEPVQIMADGQPIDTDVGHAAPFMSDWDGDGVRDLLVGQFGDGILWIYRNAGTNQMPKFEKGVQFKEGSDDGRVPTG